MSIVHDYCTCVTAVLGEVKRVQLLLEELSLLTIAVMNGDITDQTQGLST